MKNKLLVLACAAIVIMLCACQPLNVTSEGSDIVSVAFKVTDEGISAKAITIGNPLDNANVLYQYKAIPSFTPENGKALVGATGDVWTSLPSVYNGSEFKMKFSKGPWTFYFRGVDRNDLTPLYKIAAPLKVTLSSKSTMDIVFNMEADPEGFSGDNGNGFGTISLDIIAQGNSKDGELIVEYSPIVEENYTVASYTPAKIEGNKTYFIKDFKLASGNYKMFFTYQAAGKEVTYGNPYIVQVLTNQNTTVTGKIAHQSQFITYFSTPGEEFKYRATFDATAIEEGLKEKLVDNKLEEKAEKKAEEALQEAMEAKNQPQMEQIALPALEALPTKSEEKSLNNEKEALPANLKENEIEKQKIYKVFGNVNFALDTVTEKNIDPALQKKIGIIRELICGTEAFNLENYFMGQENGTSHYSIPEQLFKDIDEKHEREYSPEHVITLRVKWSNGNKTLVAESEPITLLFIH